MIFRVPCVKKNVYLPISSYDLPSEAYYVRCCKKNVISVSIHCRNMSIYVYIGVCPSWSIQGDTGRKPGFGRPNIHVMKDEDEDKAAIKP